MFIICNNPSNFRFKKKRKRKEQLDNKLYRIPLHLLLVCGLNSIDTKALETGPHL